MLVFPKPPLEQLSMVKNCKANTFFPGVPLIDLTQPDSEHHLVKACQEFGFFKVTSHGIPQTFINTLESEVIKFFSLPLTEKKKVGPPNPFGFGDKTIGPNGDVGWVEYLLLHNRSESEYQRFESVFGVSPEKFRLAVADYLTAMKNMACQILKLIAEGLQIQPNNVFSKMVMDKESDSIFRVNHYAPLVLEGQEMLQDGGNVIAFGEHTDPQIISILRSNNTAGLQIASKDGTWISIPPDEDSFFVNVGDSLQVMTNGKFKSVKHRVLTNTLKARLSMIYFGAPTLTQMIAPLPSLLGDEEEPLYREFTWLEYKQSMYKSKLGDNRLGRFEKTASS